MEQMMTMEQLQASDGEITKQQTYQNYRSILNKVNKHFGWDQDTIHYDKLNEKAYELPSVVKEHWNITSLSALKQKLSALSSLMTRTRFGRDHRVAKIIRNAEREQCVQVQNIGKDIPKWEDLQKKLVEEGKKDGVVGTVAKIFSYGYVLRVGELFITRLTDDGVSNFLDLDACHWLIRVQKNRKEKEFDVDPELCKKLSRGTWLLRKKDGEPYCKSARTLSYHHWTLPDNHTIRKSYETWNMRESGRKKEEQEKHNTILGHAPRTAEDHYVQEPDAKIQPIVKIKAKLRVGKGRPKKVPLPKDIEEIEAGKPRPIIKLKEKPQIYYWKNNPKYEKLKHKSCMCTRSIR